jgi:hypothetical protein
MCFSNITRHIDRKLSYIRGIYLYFGNDFTNYPLDDKEDDLTFQRAESLSLMQCQLCPELSSHIESCVKVA